MTDTEEYNGWTNRETWAAALHLDNNQGTYEMSHRWAAECARGDYGEFPAFQLADHLKAFFASSAISVTHYPEEASEWDRMMLSDVGSLWRVEWDEIARVILSEEEEGADQSTID